MQFQALEVALLCIRQLREPLRRLRARDPRLARQIRDAANSVTLNLGEGRRRRGADRTHHYRIASGSADEVFVGLRTAEAWGHFEGKAPTEVLQLLDGSIRMIGMWKPTGTPQFDQADVLQAAFLRAQIIQHPAESEEEEIIP